MILCIYLFDLTHFRGKCKTPSNDFAVFFGKFKTLQFPSEIIWPLMLATLYYLILINLGLDGTDRIVNGDDAIQGQFPYQV